MTAAKPNISEAMCVETFLSRVMWSLVICTGVRLPSKIRPIVATAIVTTLSAEPALASPPRLETPADAANCPSESELRNTIAGQLGRDDFDKADAPSVQVVVRRSSDGTFSGDVSVTTSSTTTRTIDGADTCAELVRAAALSIALAIEKDASEAKPTKAPEVFPPAPAETMPLGPSIERDRVAIMGSALTTVGLLPRPGAGVGLAGRVRVAERVWLSARGFVLPSTSMPNDAFSLALSGGGLGACVEPFGSRSVTAVGCAHVIGGAYAPTRDNVDLQNAKNEPYVAATLSAGARARVWGPIHLEGAVDGHLPFARPTYLATTCPPTGFEPPFMALALWFGAGISIR
jgi:hypothetical protein